MRKNLVKWLSLFLLPCLLLSSCGQSSRNKLNEGIQSLSSSLPMSIGSGLSISAITLDDDYMTYQYEVGEEAGSDFVDYFASALTPDNMKTSLCQSADTRQLVSLMGESGVGLRCVVVDKTTGRTIEAVKCSADEVKQWSKSFSEGDFDDSAAHYLKSSMEEGNAACPVQVDEVTVMTSCDYDGEAVNYYYSLLESDALSVEQLETAREQMETFLRANLSDPENLLVVNLVKRCIEANAVMRYHYVGSISEKRVTFEIDPKTL